MNKIHRNSILILLVFFVLNFAKAQEYSIDIIIKNPPENKIYLSSVQGDNSSVTDSATVKDELIQFKLNNQPTGIYRVKLGYTSERNIRNDSPQYFNFIFNNENIVLETDFFSPESATRAIQSLENEIWFDFIKQESVYKKRLIQLEKDLNYNWTIDNSDLAIKIATEYNQLQIERDLMVTQSLKIDTNLFAAKLIATFREPLLDGYLTKTQRNQIFQKEYLNTVDFNDESLVNSQVLSDKIFSYLVSYNQGSLTPQKREEAYLNAVNNVFDNLNKNKNVFEFIKNYMVHGFELLQMPNVVEYISEQEFEEEN